MQNNGIKKRLTTLNTDQEPIWASNQEEGRATATTHKHNIPGVPCFVGSRKSPGLLHVDGLSD